MLAQILVPVFTDYILYAVRRARPQIKTKRVEKNARSPHFQTSLSINCTERLADGWSLSRFRVEVLSLKWTTRPSSDFSTTRTSTCISSLKTKGTHQGWWPSQDEITDARCGNGQLAAGRCLEISAKCCSFCYTCCIVAFATRFQIKQKN